jgi:hypothetical protein
MTTPYASRGVCGVFAEARVVADGQDGHGELLELALLVLRDGMSASRSLCAS